jgi:hypothetical protein
VIALIKVSELMLQINATADFPIIDSNYLCEIFSNIQICKFVNLTIQKTVQKQFFCDVNVTLTPNLCKLSLISLVSYPHSRVF